MKYAISNYDNSFANFGLVAECKNGCAIKLRVNDCIVNVYKQAGHVLSLRMDDEVFYVDTEYGPFIIASTKPSPQWSSINNGLQLQCGDSVIEVQCDGEIKLKTQKASLQLSKDGVITINGSEITQEASKNVSINAKQNIYLNS